MRALIEQLAQRRTWLRAVKSGLVVAFMTVAVLDGLPALREGHKQVLKGLRPLLSTAGIYQGDWQLFAPDPDRINTWVEARVVRSDGSTWSWTTPDWRRRSQLEKMMEGRHQKLSDALRLDASSALWPILCDHAARLTPPVPGGARPQRVELIRSWWDVPDPGHYAAEKARHGRLPPPRERFPNRYLYYTKVLSQ